MKHLTTYKIFESTEELELITSLKDIALDSEDEGFTVKITTATVPRSLGHRPLKVLCANFTFRDYLEKNKQFEYIEISETVDRMDSYMEQNNWTRRKNDIIKPTTLLKCFDLYYVSKDEINFNDGT